MQVNTSITHMPSLHPRLRFSIRYALRHLGICIAVALFSAAMVFGLLYPPPYQAMLGVGPIYMLVLVVDVVCGPLLTLILASPKKSQRERWLDFGLIGVCQALALAYGLHSVWAARPAVLAFETDRLVVVTANQIDPAELVKAPEGLRRLPWWGVLRVGTRRAANGTEFLESVGRSLTGISTGMQPSWWLPWSQAQASMAGRAKPVTELLARRPADAGTIEAAIQASSHKTEDLHYLPLTSSKTLDWVALLDTQMNVVGWTAVDGF